MGRRHLDPNEATELKKWLEEESKKRDTIPYGEEMIGGFSAVAEMLGIAKNGQAKISDIVQNPKRNVGEDYAKLIYAYLENQGISRDQFLRSRGVRITPSLALRALDIAVEKQLDLSPSKMRQVVRELGDDADASNEEIAKRLAQAAKAPTGANSTKDEKSVRARAQPSTRVHR